MLRYCIACKEEIPAGVHTCPNCAAITHQSPAASQEAGSATPNFEGNKTLQKQQQGRSGRIWIIAGVALFLGLAAAYYFVFLQDDLASKGGVPTQAAAAPAAALAAPITLYAVTRANIRDKPSTSGSSITGTLARGITATGKLKAGQSAEDNWLELADGAGFISVVNLSETAPPQIIKLLGDKTWKADGPIDIWASAGGGDLIDRASKDTPLTLVGLVSGDYIEIKLRSGGVGYIPGGARVIALLETPSAPPITMTFRPDSCDFGGGVGVLFAQLSRQSDARRAAIENRDYANPDARQTALETYDQKNESRSIFTKVTREYKGLTITGVGIHSESQSVYFDDSPAKVIAVFKQSGYNIRGNGEFQTNELYAGIGPAAKQDRNYGNSYLNCGV